MKNKNEMNCFLRLKKIAMLITKQSDSLFNYSVEKQKEYLNKLGIPRDDIERSYYQYLCQAKLNGVILSILLNLASLPMIVYYSLKKGDSLTKENVEAVFISEGINQSVIPSVLRQEFTTWKIIDELKEYYVSEDRAQFRKIVKRYPFSWHFLFKCLIKIRIYSYLINCYNPKTIVACGEYSFTSSFLTSYCESQNRLHINVMHGEKLFFIRDSFFRFHRCYVWDEFYIKLFKALKAEDKQFIIEIPRSIVLGDGTMHNKEIDYTYYLGSESGDTLITILNALQKLKNKGFIVAIRPHPRYSNCDEVKFYFSSKFEVEDWGKISISESILRTKNVISLYSTVLNQAFHSNVDIVIDDVSNPRMFSKLKNLHYVMLEMKHKLLSKEIRS